MRARCRPALAQRRLNSSSATELVDPTSIAASASAPRRHPRNPAISRSPRGRKPFSGPSPTSRSLLQSGDREPRDPRHLARLRRPHRRNPRRRSFPPPSRKPFAKPLPLPTPASQRPKMDANAPVATCERPSRANIPSPQPRATGGTVRGTRPGTGTPTSPVACAPHILPMCSDQTSVPATHAHPPAILVSHDQA